MQAIALVVLNDHEKVEAFRSLSADKLADLLINFPMKILSNI
jgi:hypothetical protein